MKKIVYLTLLACSLQMVSCSKDFDNSTVDEFDLSRYLGLWYEIARYDHSFERGMDNTMAEYILQEELLAAGVLPADYDFEAHKELVPMQPGDVPVTYADTSALERDFGFKPSTSLRDGLRAFARWYKEYYG